MAPARFSSRRRRGIGSPRHQRRSPIHARHAEVRRGDAQVAKPAGFLGRKGDCQSDATARRCDLDRLADITLASAVLLLPSRLPRALCVRGDQRTARDDDVSRSGHGRGSSPAGMWPLQGDIHAPRQRRTGAPLTWRYRPRSTRTAGLKCRARLATTAGSLALSGASRRHFGSMTNRPSPA